MLREGEGKRYGRRQLARKERRKEASYRDSSVTVVVRRCPVVEQTRRLVSEPKRLSQATNQPVSQPAPASQRTYERASERTSKRTSKFLFYSVGIINYEFKHTMKDA